jgi:threonine synthase
LDEIDFVHAPSGCPKLQIPPLVTKVARMASSRRRRATGGLETNGNGMVATRGATHLECTRCGRTYESEQLHRLSPCCEKPLYARYDLDSMRDRFQPALLAVREPTLWRYAEVLPVRDPAFRLTLGEGFTPLLPVPRLGARLGVPNLWIKDEGQNPTGSFKARGLAVAVARAWELGAREVAIPSAGNAGSATAAYAAAAGIRAHVVAPRDTPLPIIEETRALGADLELIDGLITDAGKRVAECAAAAGWFDLSTLKEPYRVEGKKTMGYELVEQLGGRLPDAIIYPTGGGTGLVGMWKAFEEMQVLGWIGAERPKMISVQATGCAPIVQAFESGAEYAEPWKDATTYASGLRVPRAVGDFLILHAIRASGGAAVAVSDQAMAEAVLTMGASTGIFAAPEGGATAAAVPILLSRGVLDPADEVVLFNTGSGLKYVTA